MNFKKPLPPHPATIRRLCPVCKMPSYSAGGIHPQCMQRSNDLLAKPIHVAKRDAH